MSLTPEQEVLRLGKLTASKAATIMSDLGTKGLDEYVRRIAGERVFGDLGEKGYKSEWMDRGSELENPALDFFEFEYEVTLDRQPHIEHPTIPNVSATPDGLCAAYNVEAKVPLFHVWCEAREHWQRGWRGLKAIPSAYRWQARWQTWCCGTPEGRFVVYHPAAGGQAVVIPYTVEQSEFEQIAARVRVVEGLISNWVDILRSKP